MSDYDTHDDYETGYKKPPRNSQFQRGQSGNPRGRPKGTKNARTILMELVSEKITITVNGKRKTVSKLEASLMQLVNKALQGDLKAQHKVLLMLDENEAVEEAKQQTRFNSEADQRIMENLKERFRNDNNS